MNTFDLYDKLAEVCQAQGRYQERDRFIVLAIDAAQQAGRTEMAEQGRKRLLELNPNHLVRPYPTYQAALQSPNFSEYMNQLRKNFPPNKAQEILNEMRGGASTGRHTMLAEEGPAAIYPIRQEPAMAGPTLPDPLPPLPKPPPRPAPGIIPLQAPPPPTHIIEPVPRGREAVYSPGGAALGNLLFALVGGVSILMLGYVFIWPLMK